MKLFNFFPNNFDSPSAIFPHYIRFLVLFLIILPSFFGGGCAGGTRGTGSIEEFKIRGVLVDSATKEPIPGATITILPSGIFTTTDSSGNFLISTTYSSADLTLGFASEGRFSQATLGSFAEGTHSIFVELELNSIDGSVDVVDIVIEPKSTASTPSPSVTPASTQIITNPTSQPTSRPHNPTTTPTITPTPTPEPPSSPPPNSPPVLQSFNTPVLTSSNFTAVITSNEAVTISANLSISNETKNSSTLQSSHTFHFSGLIPETSYTLSFTLTDAEGATSQTYQQTIITPKAPTMSFDTLGLGGINQSGILLVSAVDMGSGASAIRSNSPSEIEIFSRHNFITSSGGELTAVLYTTFTNVQLIFGNTYQFITPTGGYFEIWYEDGSGGSAISSNPQGYSDGILVASGIISDGFGSVDTGYSFGSVNLDFQINSSNPAYFFSLAPSQGSISFLIGNSSGGFNQPKFPLVAGGLISTINNLNSLYNFPDGSISIN